MGASITTAAAVGRAPRTVSGKSALKRLGRVVFAGVFVALAVGLVPVAAIYSFIWLAKF